MSILSDLEITELCNVPWAGKGPKPMIVPFINHSSRLRSADNKVRRILSFGLSSYGYDVQLDVEVKFFTNINSAIVDPKQFDDKCLVDATILTDDDGARYVLLPPNSYMLGHTVEWFSIPRDVMVLCLGKSTYARAGILVNATPIEAGFEGNVVIEVSNGTNLPSKIYLNEGIAQFLFFRGDVPCKVSYADRDGKYQNQTGLTLPKV